MKSIAVAASLGFATSVLASPSPVELAPRQQATLEPVEVRGNAFFRGDERFYIKGIDYQPGGSSDLSDPLANPEVCRRDIEKFADLGLNTVRIYSVDNSADHSECMQLLADNGIYLVLDVNSPLYSLNRDNPGPSYNSVYLQNIFATIDKFADYTNTLAFFSANEVINDDRTTFNAPYIKAVTRDMRQYIGSRGYRQIPVGYSAADVIENRMEMAHYMNCGTDDERSDFFAFNDYSWCSPSSFTTSGWDQKVQNFTDYGIPIFLSEFGCIENTRLFDEFTALYNPEMTSVFSGGLVYEYSLEPNKYGIVEISSDGAVSELPDYATLKRQLAANPPPSGDGGYNPDHAASECPEFGPNWNVTSNDLPAIPKAALKFMDDGAGPGVGLTGDGSQSAGDASTGMATPGSGSVTATASSASRTSGASGSSSASEGAAAGKMAPFDFAPLVMGAVVVGFTGLGAVLL